MRARRWVLAGAAFVLACAVGAGVGAAAPPQKRLNQSQWQSYVTANTAFLATTNKAVAIFRRCRNTTAYKGQAALAACFGKAPDQEIAATQVYEALLHHFDHKTVGSCSDALAQYQGKLQLWRYAVIGVKRAVVSTLSSVTNIEGQAKQALVAYNGVAAANVAYVPVCKPLKR